MALLDLQQIKQLNTYLQQPAPAARLYVYGLQTKSLIPVFQDEDLTIMQANPLKADVNGAFPAAYLFEGDYRVEIQTDQGQTLRDVDVVAVRSITRTLSSAQAMLNDPSISYDGTTGSNHVVPGEVLRVVDGGFSYRVTDQFDDSADLTTVSGVRLTVLGREQFTPETFGASGDGQTNDTEAWNDMLRAVSLATHTGPVQIYARGHYLLDTLDGLFQVTNTATHPQQLNSVTFDLAGAVLRHSGVGEGILPLEGSATERSRYEIQGGIFQGHANSTWLIRTRDVRGSLISPEAFLGPSPCYGLLMQNWRSWSENNQIGGVRVLEGSGIGRIVGIQGRKEAWAFELSLSGIPTDPADFIGELSVEPGAGSAGSYYFDTAIQIVRRHNGSAWVNQIPLMGVFSDVGGKSFARTKIHNILVAAPHDVSVDGIVIETQGGSIYDSDIDGVRGNVTNNGGSLIYWNDNYAPNTVIRNIACEKADESGNPDSYAFRIGPNFLDAAEPPEMYSVQWSGGHADITDPDAGIVATGQYRQQFLSVVADTPETVLKAGQLHPNTTVEVTLKSNSNTVMGTAIVGRKLSTSALRIQDVMAQRVSAGPWGKSGITASFPITEMDGARWIAPSAGWVTGITLITDQPRSGGTCTAAVRHNDGLSGATGKSIGVGAILNNSDPERAIKRQDPGIDGFAAGDELYAVVTSTGTWAPSGATVRAIIDVQLDGDISWLEDNGDLTATTRVDETLRIMTRVLKT